jgi:hypothetical protein
MSEENIINIVTSIVVITQKGNILRSIVFIFKLFIFGKQNRPRNRLIFGLKRKLSTIIKIIKAVIYYFDKALSKFWEMKPCLKN